MAYRTGAVLGVDALMDELVDFATTEAGWTLLDTLAANDKVIFSNGSDDDLAMTYRIASSLNADANPFYNAPMNLHRACNHVLVLGYHNWDVGTHTGTNCYGHAGPFVFIGPLSDDHIDTGYVRYSAENPPMQENAWQRYTPKQPGSMYHYDGTRMLLGVQSNRIKMADLVTTYSFLGSTQSGISAGDGNQSAFVYDINTDDYVLYVLSNATSASMNQWWKYELDTDSWTRLANPGFTTSPSGAMVEYDGVDYIYVLYSTFFKRYQISTNTWSDLAAPPTARSVTNFTGAGYCPSVSVYVPSSISGYAGDVIYAFLAASGTTIYCYNVATDTWGSGGGQPHVTNPITNGVGSALFWDYQRYMYSMNVSTSSATYEFMYRADLTASPITWELIGSHNGAMASQAKAYLHISPIPAKIRANHSANTTYWFVGDEDSIAVVAELRGHYYWMYFGRYDQYNNTSISILTAPVSAGTIPTITVNSTSGLSVGDKVTFFDASTGAAEQATIYSVDSATTFRANLTGNYTIGTRVGVDPAPYCNAGNGLAVTPIGPKGYFKDLMNSTYAILPAVSISQSERNGPNPRGAYHLYPQKLTQENSTMSNHEDLGNLRNVFGIRTGDGSTALRAEDIMYFNGQPYMIFPTTLTKRFTDNRWIALGPLV